MSLHTFPKINLYNTDIIHISQSIRKTFTSPQADFSSLRHSLSHRNKSATVRKVRIVSLQIRYAIA